MEARTGQGTGGPRVQHGRGHPGSARWLAPLVLLALIAGNAWAEGFEIIDLGPEPELASEPESEAAQAPEAELDVQARPVRFEADLVPEAIPVATRATPASPMLVMDAGLPQQRSSEASVAMPMPPPLPPEAKEADEPLLKLGVGDQVALQVFGRPEFNTTTYVSDDGTISVPLAGAVDVAGKSPSGAAMAVARALKAGQFLVNPQVTITLPQFKSQQVSVLGEVRNPGRYPLDSKTTLLDLLAQAGGVAETGSTTVYLIRGNAEGKPERRAVDLLGLASGKGELPDVRIRSGDSVFVPRAQQYYVYGEVQNPNMYPLQPGTTVLQAISRSGGLTPRGSDSRIVIKRKDKNGKYRNLDAELTDYVEADDVIRVKERIF